MSEPPLKIGITCYPSVGGSGIVASALGEELANRGHEVHFISYERPFRMPKDAPRLFFHPVEINDYGLFKYPDYTLPLSVKMAEVTSEIGLDILHVHYAVPHATAALLARSMLPADRQPGVVTTLHGTDTTLLGRDPGYGPAIRHALDASDAVTTVSEFLADETRKMFGVHRPIDVIHNFFSPRAPKRPASEVSDELGLNGEAVLFHASNLRQPKRIDLLLESVSKIQSRRPFKLLVLAGDDFSPHMEQARRLGVGDRIIVREKVIDVEDYLQVADVGVFTSESESFCLTILECMFFGVPSVAFRVGGIPEVVNDQTSGVLVACGDVHAHSNAISALLDDEGFRGSISTAARSRAIERFSPGAIISKYEDLYRRIKK